MSYAFSDQQSKLSSLLGDSNTSTDDAFSLATRKKEINRGELQFAKDSHLYKNYATGTIAIGELSVPSDWLETFTFIVNNYVIKNDREVSVEDWERLYNYTGQPPYYYYWEFSGTRKIKFFGSVDGQTYYIYYYAKPTTELSGDSDVSVFPEEYREASVYYAAAELLQQQGKHEQSDKYRLIYANFVRKAMEDGEKHHISKNYAAPDLNIMGGSQTSDYQGQGIW